MTNLLKAQRGGLMKNAENTWTRMLDIRIADKYGLNEALVISQIDYWLKRSSNVRDGHKWVYKTFEGWHQEFPFLSVSTIKVIFKNLVSKGIVIKGRYNKHKRDRTNWYTLNQKMVDQLRGVNEPEKAVELPPDHSADNAPPSGKSCIMDSAISAPPLPKITPDITNKEKREIYKEKDQGGLINVGVRSTDTRKSIEGRSSVESINSKYVTQIIRNHDTHNKKMLQDYFDSVTFIDDYGKISANEIYSFLKSLIAYLAFKANKCGLIFNPKEVGNPDSGYGRQLKVLFKALYYKDSSKHWVIKAGLKPDDQRIKDALCKHVMKHNSDIAKEDFSLLDGKKVAEVVIEAITNGGRIGQIPASTV